MVETSSFGERGRVGGEKWISLRLDGHGFSKLVQRMRREEVFCKGYSKEFGRIMGECCVALMEQFACLCGYTQSDEITVIIPVCFFFFLVFILLSLLCWVDELFFFFFFVKKCYVNIL